MPTYEYRCSACGEFEVFQKISDPPLSACPTCGKPVRRLVSGGSTFILKGRNWISKMPSSSDDIKTLKERIFKRTIEQEAEETPKNPPKVRVKGKRKRITPKKVH
ncbi:MAG: zinc ribbon domain-containing protein [Deltaproteobacteria bacterium]|nr:MAG: zinc ribbon domain-containing protein [Deltaproteobacteria bacterium]